MQNWEHVQVRFTLCHFPRISIYSYSSPSSCWNDSTSSPPRRTAATSPASSRGTSTESEFSFPLSYFPNIQSADISSFLRAAHLRQSILLSAYETPELRALYSKSLVNVAGKIKAEAHYEGVLANVPTGIKQVFTRFETPDLYSEDDARFEHFTTKVRQLLELVAST